MNQSTVTQTAAPQLNSTGSQILLQRTCACGNHTADGGQCESCRKRRKAAALQRAASHAGAVSAAPPIVYEVLRTPGQPLDPATRAFMEPRFGYDFSQVRVHTDVQAANSALAVGASAYAVGDHIAFATGRYAPHMEAGRHLLAHELTHVVQQRGAGGHFAGELSDPTDASETEAAHIADLIVGHSSLRIAAVSSAHIHLARNGPPGGPASTTLPTVDPSTIPASWQRTPVPASGGQDVYVYRGFARNAAAKIGAVLREGDIGGVLSRRIDAAQDAIFNQVGRDPVLSGPEPAGVVRVRVPAAIWDELVRTNSISERGGYPGFSGQLSSTEIRVNSPEAARLINSQPAEVIPPDPYYDFRPGATRPARPAQPAAGETSAAERPTRPPRASTPGSATEPAPGGGAGSTAPTEFRVNTRFRVLNAITEGANTVAEVEATLGEGLEALNRTARANGGRALPARVVLRMTISPEGALVAAEATTGEAAAFAETLARQAVATVPRATAGAEAAPAVAGAARVSPWVRGVGWAGLAVFFGVTWYQYEQATPEQKPRVLATAGGGLAGGMLSGYLVCNLILGIETVGWSLLGCLFVAGIPGGMLGSAATGSVYDATVATPLERALHDLEGQPENVRRLFYAMVEQATPRGGLPITEQFVREFISSVPSDLANDELATLTSQFTGVLAGDTLEGVLRSLRQAIQRLPRRRPVVLPPRLDITDVLRGPGTGYRLDALGSGRIRLLPSPRPVDPRWPPSPAQPAPTVPILEFEL